MRACVWIAIAGALSAIGCGGSPDKQLFEQVNVAAGSGAGGKTSAARPAPPSGQSGAPADLAAGGSDSAAGSAQDFAGAPDEPTNAAGSGTAGAAGAPTVVPPGPECTGAFTQLCPAVDDCLDPGKRTCVGGKWSECACLDTCKTGEGRECTTDPPASTDGVQICGDDRQWGACYAPPPNGPWPAHVLCHMPADIGNDLGADADGKKQQSTDYPVCVLSCFFAGSTYREDQMSVKADPPRSDHCVQQPADMCWRCP